MACAQLHVAVIDRIDAHNVRLPDLFQKRRNDLIKTILVHLLAIGSSDGSYPHRFVAVIGHDIQRTGSGFLDERLRGVIVDWHGKMLFHLGRGRRSRGRRARGRGGPAIAGSGEGTVMVWEQAGHSISDPAPLTSTASSCSQLGQLNVMSINDRFRAVYGVSITARPQKSSEIFREFWDGCKSLVEPASRRSFLASRQKHLRPEAAVGDSLRHEGRSARILL